jgi:RNA polymerase sigma-70 factor (ECF subfamily)
MPDSVGKKDGSQPGIGIPQPVAAEGAESGLVVREMERVEQLTGEFKVDAKPSAPSYLTPEQVNLIARARAGEQRALRILYETHQAQVRGHLYRLLGPDPEVDDLVQTVFSRAFNALGSFKGNSTLSTWLYRITANTTHNLLRQRYRRDRVKRALKWFNDGRGTHVAAEKLEARDEAMRLLRLLPPELREIFVLYHYQGLTLQEISRIVERPISTVGDRLSRARKRLRELV